MTSTMNTPNPSRIPWRDAISSISCSDRSRIRTPSHAHWAASDRRRRGERGAGQDRPAPSGLTLIRGPRRQLVHELLERRRQAVEAPRDVERLQKLLAERGVGHDGRGDPVGDHPRAPVPPPAPFEQIGRTIQRLAASAPHASRMRASAADTSAVGETVLELLRA